MEDLSSYIFQMKLEKAEQLIQNGHDINGVTQSRPILSAVESDNPEALKFVLANGANPNIDQGLPLLVAIDYALDGMIQNNRTKPYPEPIKMVEILIKNGADPLLKNSKGQRPIDVLVSYASNNESLDRLKSFFRPFLPEVDGISIEEN